MERNIRSHYTYDGKVKKGYDTEFDALYAARKINSDVYSIHKMVVYKCSKCDKYHLGHNNTVLTDEDREKARIALSRMKNGNY